MSDAMTSPDSKRGADGEEEVCDKETRRPRGLEKGESKSVEYMRTFHCRKDERNKGEMKKVHKVMKTFVAQRGA